MSDDPAPKDARDSPSAAGPGPSGAASAGGSRVAGTGAQPAGAIEYDCSPWAQETRLVLRSLVAESSVPHAWEGTVLVVPGAFEDSVDELVEAALSTARSSIGTSRETVAYALWDFSAASQNRLVDSLVEARIPHAWDAEGDLVVHDDDAEEVEGLIDALGDPDGGDDLDGLELHERLSELFVSADRLVRDPADAKALRAARTAYESVSGASVPFGVDQEQWLTLHRLVEDLFAALGAVGESPEERLEQPADPDDPQDGSGRDRLDAEVSGQRPRDRAAALRDLLRSFV